MKHYDFNEYYANIEIPETWKTLEDFVRWFMDNRMPIMIPQNPNIVVSDNATAYTIFRKEPYQVEVYVNYPNCRIAEHGHPGMEVITMSLTNFGGFAKKLNKGKKHGGPEFDSPAGIGSVMFTFEKWPEGAEITTAAANWVGETAGPLQEAIIKSRYPNAHIENGYADVTKNV